jgi:hypothetical protein
MNIRRLFLTAVAAAVLSTTGVGMAMAAPHDRGGHSDRDRGDRHDRDYRGDHRGDRRDGYRHDRDRRDSYRHNSYRGHDRYWRQEYRRGYIGHDRVFFNLRRHHYNRFIGDPYWYDGRYVVRTYDRYGRVIFVEVNSYTGAFIGVIRF